MRFATLRRVKNITQKEAKSSLQSSEGFQGTRAWSLRKAYVPFPVRYRKVYALHKRSEVTEHERKYTFNENCMIILNSVGIYKILFFLFLSRIPLLLRNYFHTIIQLSLILHVHFHHHSLCLHSLTLALVSSLLQLINCNTIRFFWFSYRKKQTFWSPKI